MNRFIKPFLIGLTGLTILALLFSLITPSTVRVSRMVTMHTSATQVYPQVTILNNWKNWHPLFKDSSAFIPPSITNKEITVHYNDKVTSLQVTSIDSTGISFLLKAEGENDIANRITILPVEQPNTVAVEWSAVVQLKWYPWEKLYGMVVDKIIGPGFEQSLNGLKEFCEKK